MGKNIETLYKFSPIFFQNIMISLYGLKLYNERYSKPWGSFYNNLLKTQYASDAKINELQKKSLIKLLSDASVHVPYYREMSEVITRNLKDKSIQQILKKIPILEKENIRYDAESFTSELYNKKSLITLNTSGTTGTPLTVYLSPEARKLNYAFFERSKTWAGIKKFERSVTLAGRTIVSPDQEDPPFWRENYLLNNTLFSSYHLSDRNVEHYVKKIREIMPVFIDSYPSSLAIIAEYCLKNNITTIRPRAIITSAETLFDHQRDKVEKAFGCKVFDQYGCTEQVVFACQCEKGSYHVNPEFGILEVLDNNNQQVEYGELGEFVCTGFTNPAMPLIRYKIGDMGVLSNQKCSCGRNFPVIKAIYGRNDDILVTPDGKYIGRLDPIFKGVESTIKETQIIQKEIDFVEICIVKSVGYVEDVDGQFIVQELRKRMGTEINYKLTYLDLIPRESNGKFRAVINKMSNKNYTK